MSLLTSLLKLFKWNTTDETDLEQEFDIDKAMNDNWDKLDDFAERVNDAVIEIQDDIEEIQNKNTEQDETINTINESISSIQAKDEAQDTEIDKQSDLIQKLKDNCINVTTEEATQLQVKDASTLPAKLDVRGNHSQKTREGYNIWDYLSAVLSSAGGLTIEKDYENGYITVNGMPSKDYVSIVSTAYITNLLEDGQRYTLWQENYQNEETAGIYLQVARTDDNGTTRYYSLSNSATFLVDKSNNASYSIILQTSTVANTKTLSNYKNRYMLYKGTDEKSYELPGASPSLDYPSEVRAVGDNINIFDKDNMNKILATPSGLTVIASSSGGASLYLEVKSNTDYTISRKIVGQRFLAATSVEVPAVGGTLTQNVPNNTGDGIHIKTGKNDKYLLVYYLYNNSENEEEILSSIKIEEGTEATSYSPYGQGSVEVKKINSNIMPILELGSYWKYTEKGIQNIEGNSGHTITSFNLKKGQTIKVGFKLFSKPTVSTSFTGYIDGAENTNLNLTNINNFNLNQVYTRTYTATKDCKFGYVMWGNSNTSIFEFQLWANLENAEDYQQYEEQSYILDIQKPMLNGDCFDFKNNKEVHIWKENTLNGTENWQQSSIYNDIYYLQDNNMSSDISKGNLICDQFFFGGIVTSTDDMENNKCYRYQTGTILSNNIYVKNSNFKSVTDFKAALAEKNMTLYYIAKYATQLDLTKQQKEVLNQLAELPIFKGTNNIITAESLALMQMEYIADTQSYIDSKLNNINQQILKLAGGN